MKNVAAFILSAWLVAALIVIGCKQPPGYTPTPAEAAAPVVAPAKKAAETATGAATDVKRADGKLGTLEKRAASQPSVPSPVVNEAAGSARLDLAAALVKLNDTVRYASDAAQRALDLGGQLVTVIKERNELRAWKDTVNDWWLGPKFWRTWWEFLIVVGVLGVLSALASSGVPWLAFLLPAERLIGKALKFVLTGGIPFVVSLIGRLFKGSPSAPATPTTDPGKAGS